ncbi:MAG: hypothetical protein ACLQJ0_25535 [Steroidobacteraceae bacterium]|jgi:hypothetical protein
MARNAPEDGLTAEQRGHEVFDMNVSYLGWFSVGIVILLIVTAFVAFYLLGGFRISNAVLHAQSTNGAAAPFATLQDTPQDDLRSYRRSKAAALEGYHWVDRGGGVVQIPIERAMELVAAEAGARAAAVSVMPAPPAPPPQSRERKP